MTGINIAIKFFILVCVIVISAITSCSGAISDARLCFDPKCSEPVSTATTLMRYQSNDPGILSFESNVELTVFSKSAGKRLDLWGVEINGKRGYVPVSMIKEKKVLRKNLIHQVPTEQEEPQIPESMESQDVPIVAENVELVEKVETQPIAQQPVEPEEKLVLEPSQVSPSFEVHDGTTIPMTIMEEPPVPSYSTAALQNEPKVEEHPVLSVHPNIASSMTLKENAEEISIGDTIDAEKYMEIAGLDKDISAKELGDLWQNEIGESMPLDLNFPTEPHAEEFLNVQNDPNAKITPNNGEFDSEDSLFSSPRESPIINDSTSDSGAAVEPETVTNDPAPDLPNGSNKSENNSNSEQTEGVAPIEQELDRPDAEKSTEQPAGEEKEDKTSSDTLGDVVTDKNAEMPVDQKLQEPSPIETLSGPMSDDKKDTEAPGTNYDEQKTNDEPPTNEEQEKTEQRVTNDEERVPEKSVANEKDETLEKALENEEQKIPEQGKENETEKTAENPVEDPASTETFEKLQNPEMASQSQVPEPEVEEILVDQKISAENEVKTQNELPTNENDSESSSPEAETWPKDSKVENSPPEAQLPVGQENPDEKSSEQVASNLNIMNPLFGRLSMLPSLVRDAVDNALSPSPETQDPRESEGESAEKIEENERKIELEKMPEIPLADPTSTPEFNDQIGLENIVDNADNNNNLESDKIKNESTADSIDTTRNVVIDNSAQPGIYKQDELSGFGQEKYAVDETSSFNGFPANRNLLNVGSGLQPDDHKSAADSSEILHTENSFHHKEDEKEKKLDEELAKEDFPGVADAPNDISETERHIATETIDSCLVDSTCQKPEGLDENHSFVREVEEEPTEEGAGVMDVISIGRNYWETLTYLVVTAITTLLFSLGYYYIENTRRDSQYIAKINELEKQLLVCSKECTQLDDTLKSTKTKLDSIEDESFGSNEMVASLKADLEASKTAKSELEDQVAILEKELESATEAGLELERMLREILTTNNEDNPLAQSVEDLQTRLNAQQAANEALTNALNLKAQENETLAAELKASSVKSEQLEVEVTRLTEELKHQLNLKSNVEHALLEKVESLEKQVKDITAERINLRQQLKGKEMELKDLLEVVNHMNINNLDFEKLYNVSKVKAEASQLLEERDDLKMRLTEVEGAHQLLEEHVKLINEEVASLSEQCKLAEKAKRDAETRVEVLSNFFKEKEAQRQKEEAVWLEKQGEVSSTVERLHAMQNEIQNYKQQIEMLKREILDQEREYKNQISTLETKSHENWVLARQNERRLEESKAEAGQLRNRLTLIEKNLNDADPEAKLHRLEANGETPTSPQLYMGAEASSSPIMFSASSGVPLPPPPSYLYGPPVPPFMPPPPHASGGMTSYEVGQRPPPLGGRLSSPPPLPPVNSGRYDNPRSPPPPIQSYGPHRAFPPFPNERIHPPPPPPHSSHLPPPLPPLSNSSGHSWPDEAIPPPPLRNSGFQPHQQTSQHHHHHHPPPPPPPHHHHHHRDNQQRSRNHKGSLHSSGESLDKNL